MGRRWGSVLRAGLRILPRRYVWAFCCAVRMGGMEPNPYQSPVHVPDTAPNLQEVCEREHPLVEVIIKVSFGVLIASISIVLLLLITSLL